MRALLLLRLALAGVLGGQAAILLLHTTREAIGLPVVVVAVTELLGSALLLSRWVVAGAVLTLASLAGATLLHGLAREWVPASFVVYAAALFTVARSNREGP